MKPDPGHSESWRPSASIEYLKAKASILADIRAFFAARDILEVDTPVLSRSATTDPGIESFVTQYTGPGSKGASVLYMHTSPEFSMKRLLAAGSGSIYQICKVFRNEENGRLHNPEFTLLEWYRTDFDHHLMMDELEVLVSGLFQPILQLDSTERLSYAEAFQLYAGFDPHQVDLKTLKSCAARHGIPVPTSMQADSEGSHKGNGKDSNKSENENSDKDAWLDLILTQIVEPHLGNNRLTFIYDYPASQASLAKIRQTNEPGVPVVAERFELYFQGIELANGFHELQDHQEQRLRFQSDLQKRVSAGKPAILYDDHLLDALKHGLPACSGVAVGLDRLLMLAFGEKLLYKVITFSFERA